MKQQQCHNHEHPALYDRRISRIILRGWLNSCLKVVVFDWSSAGDGDKTSIGSIPASARVCWKCINGQPMPSFGIDLNLGRIELDRRQATPDARASSYRQSAVIACSHHWTRVCSRRSQYTSASHAIRTAAVAASTRYAEAVYVHAYPHILCILYVNIYGFYSWMLTSLAYVLLLLTMNSCVSFLWCIHAIQNTSFSVFDTLFLIKMYLYVWVTNKFCNRNFMW